MLTLRELKDSLVRLSISPEELVVAMDIPLEELMEALHDQMADRQELLEESFFLDEEDEESE